MSSWIFLVAAMAFAWLAYDAWKVATPAADVPYSLTAKGLGQDLSGVPLQEQKARKEWNALYGLGDLSQMVWLWGILAIACAIAAATGFLA